MASVEIVNAGFTRFTNAVDGDMVLYTDSNTQSVCFGVNMGSNAALRITRCNIEIGVDVTLSNRDVAAQRLVIGMTPAGINTQTITSGFITSSASTVFGSTLGISSTAAPAYTFALSNTQTDFRFINSTSNFIAFTSNMQVLGASNDTVSVPAYAWSNDVSTGLYHANTGVVGVTCGGVANVTFSNTNMIVASNVGGECVGMFRNRIINGDMRVDQRFLGGVATFNNTSGYGIDRWYVLALGATNNGVITSQRSTVVPPNTPFVNSLLITASTARTSPAAGDNFQLLQLIEGLNHADFMLGTASAFPFTLSFWVRCSLTGTFGGSVANHNDTAAYPFSFVINAANTWEYKTLTIPPCTTGSWATDNSRGLSLHLDLGLGSSYDASLGSFNSTWISTSSLSASTFVKFVRTGAATMYLTGVQIEKGTIATRFELRTLMMETLLCQRYHFRRWNDTGYDRYGFFVADSSSVGFGQVRLPSRLRALPTVSVSNSADFFTINGTIAASSIVNSTHIGLFQASGSGFTAGTCAQFGIAGRAALTVWMAFDCEMY